MEAEDPRQPSLLDAIRAASLPVGPPCAVKRLTEKLAEPDSSEFVQVVEDLTIKTSVIGRVMRERGHSIGDDSLRRHRRKVCACNRTFESS